ncbi:MAG: hypothetical protein M3453_02825 [Pseudomonadota bacterium]|nr:hypothetical protein [Pseudomonadota bacterium]
MVAKLHFLLAVRAVPLVPPAMLEDSDVRLSRESGCQIRGRAFRDNGEREGEGISASEGKEPLDLRRHRLSVVVTPPEDEHPGLLLGRVEELPEAVAFSVA